VSRERDDQVLIPAQASAVRTTSSHFHPLVLKTQLNLTREKGLGARETFLAQEWRNGALAIAEKRECQKMKFTRLLCIRGAFQAWAILGFSLNTIW